MGKEVVLEFEIERDDFAKAGRASSNIKKMLRQLSIDPEIIRRVAIVTYEAEMNMVIHSLGGTIKAVIGTDYIEIIAIDKGPGIDDIELAMQEGYSTAPERIRELGFGAGMGLPNMKNNSDEFHIHSEGHTCVKMKIYYK